MTVADSGPIIAFARIERLELIRQVFGELIIPEAVYQEVVVRGGGRAGASEVEGGQWITRRSVTNRAMLDHIPRRLHLGEREAIVLAQELGDTLLIDERRGRAFALPEGIEVIGSMNILSRAKRRGIIELVAPVLEAILSTGYWIDEELVATFLEEIGESSDSSS